MAEKIDNEELKRLALLKVAEGRVELTAQVNRLRTELNPRLAARRVFEQHTGAVVLVTAAASLLITALVVRNRHKSHDQRPRWQQQRGQHHDKETGRSFLGSLVRAATPFLIKVAVTKPLAQYFTPRQQDEPHSP